MINVLIADDERLSRVRLKELFQNRKDFFIQYEAVNGDEVYTVLAHKKIDVVFLDINMPGKSVFESLRELKFEGMIVFQTAYSEFAVKAFDVDAVDYLLKPYSKDRFSICIEKIISKFNEKQNKNNNAVIVLKQQDNTKIVRISDIVYLTMGNSIITIKLKDKTTLFSDKTLTYFESLLPECAFFRTSRNALINIKCIVSFHKNCSGVNYIEMNNGERIELSRRRVKDLKSLIDF
ncbi:MAG: hypothetical protein A2015_04480 [Spirochaetes bacterium GWF1_31_7]|nr:MAG: hypothetical protein A2Y30_16790 [Spirochaetes bacterium GWE1_32_154]OHD51590.1 MAG: hypothetical protein A2Y29_07535 [Spirochaetes bacterium GWE2_31_10]OHD52976.1 MAG: hypothetical protein A2015_04480 [Spirochaetes bacterium GWF1_31_7]HBD93721.1 hypothetical protein [Spirochaetia bacterium]HBI37225.1 hypothetical protein [Spirochaetia bacterium]